MERKRAVSSAKALEEQAEVGKSNEQAEVMSIAQIQGLVRLLDRSDVSELELKNASEGLHLVLRKRKAGDAQASGITYTASNGASPAAANATGEATQGGKRTTVKSALVGIFHPWLKPGGKALAQVGDRVKTGQIIGTIESLNVLNEVEATASGRIAEIHVVDGQTAEYGQILVTIESVEAEDA